MTADTLYLLVRGEPYLSACQNWRRRYQDAQTAAFSFADSLGARGFFRGFDHELIGLTPAEPVPAGWTLLKRKGRLQSRLVPAKGIAGDDARRAIAALPPVPKWRELANLINHPCQIVWHTPDGSASGSSTCGANFWSLVDIAWAGESLAILAVDTAQRIADIRREHPGAKIEIGEWSVPPGLLPISKARWRLIEAQSRVDAEEVAT